MRMDRDTFLRAVKGLYPQGTHDNCLNRIFSAFDPSRVDSIKYDEVVCAIFVLQRFLATGLLL
ncbi:unnamed protein product [Heterosigma akashiwo]